MEDDEERNAIVRSYSEEVEASWSGGSGDVVGGMRWDNGAMVEVVAYDAHLDSHDGVDRRPQPHSCSAPPSTVVDVGFDDRRCDVLSRSLASDL